MFSPKTFKSAWSIGLLAGAMWIPSVATDRVVPTTYKTLLGAYNAAVAGDRILVKADVSTAGFAISKSITIESDYSTSGIIRKISLTSITPLTMDANDITFTNLKIVGYNSSGTIIRVNAGKSGGGMNNCTIQGPAQYAVRDWGSADNGSYSMGFSQSRIQNTTYGIYGDNVQNCFIFATDINSSYRNIRSARTNGSTVPIKFYLLSPNLYAGTATNAACIFSQNSDKNRPSRFNWETGSVQAWGAGARCHWMEGYYILDGASAAHIYCPEDWTGAK
jgi:hypothetical protein